jgi:hypothetical protein
VIEEPAFAVTYTGFEGGCNGHCLVVMAGLAMFDQKNVIAVRVGRRLRGGETRRCGRLVDPRLFGPPVPAREWCKRLRAQCPDTKAEAAIQKYSAVLPGIKFDAARHTNSQP